MFNAHVITAPSAGFSSLAARAAHRIAHELARLAAAAEQRSQQRQRARQQRLTEQALSGLSARTLRDIGIERSDIEPLAVALARDVEAARLRAWLAIGSRIA